jgi:hypothetical protein
MKFDEELTGSDALVAKQFHAVSRKNVNRSGYPAKKAFSVHEIGFFRKRVLTRTYICKEQRKFPGLKALNEFMTVAMHVIN